MNSEKENGILHIVATPISNLGDVSQRMQETLAAAGIIVCEDILFLNSRSWRRQRGKAIPICEKIRLNGFFCKKALVHKSNFE